MFGKRIGWLGERVGWLIGLLVLAGLKRLGVKGYCDGACLAAWNRTTRSREGHRDTVA